MLPNWVKSIFKGIMCTLFLESVCPNSSLLSADLSAFWVETYLKLQSETWCWHRERTEVGVHAARLYPKPPSAAWREAQAALPWGRVGKLAAIPETRPQPKEKYHWEYFPKKGSSERGRKITHLLQQQNKEKGIKAWLCLPALSLVRCFRTHITVHGCKYTYWL